MAATYAPSEAERPIHAVGDLYVLVGTVTFSGSYATGGDTLAFDSILKQIGRGDVFHVTVHSKAGYSFEYDYTNKKLLVRQGGSAVSTPEAEIPAAAYPAALTTGNAKVVVIGR